VLPGRLSDTAKVLVEVASSRLTMANVVPHWDMELGAFRSRAGVGH
jgi:hypothetical protein